MQKLLSLVFGLHLLVGNVCLMNVAYAAEPAPMSHHQDMMSHRSHDQHDNCADGECLFQQDSGPVGLASEQTPDDGRGALAEYAQPLLLQVLLVLVPPPSPLSTHAPPSLYGAERMVVLRQ